MASETREITDSRVLTAMSHPVRRRLLDALAVDGPSSVSMLAARTGQAPGNVSHHMKALAQAELVEEAPELARDRRERWWRRVDDWLRWSSTTFDQDPAGFADAAFSATAWLQVTPGELAELSAEVVELLTRWRERSVPDDGAERETVFVFAHGVPAEP